VHKYDEYLPKSEIERIVAANSPVMNRSPKMSKSAQKQKAVQKLQQGASSLSIKNFPTAPINDFGITPPVMQYLEVSPRRHDRCVTKTNLIQIGETFFFMRDLMEHSQQKQMRPGDALKSLVSSFEEQAANQQQNAGGSGQQSQPQPQPQPQNPMQMSMQRGPSQFPMGSRTPMQGQMQLPGQQTNFSPSVSHMGLPMHHLNGPMPMHGSPHIAHQQGLPMGLAANPNLNLGQSHTPSPHQSNMAAPPMIPQHSHQGTNSSAASVNTSPNAAQKRRRSQVKLEGDDGVEVNGTQGSRVKASPRVGGNKKAKQ